MRREILRLLAREALTERDLAKKLGLSPPSIGHHLNSLKRRGLVSLVRREVGRHGIVMKFYKANARFLVIDTENMPLSVKRYFMPMDVERARGVAAGLAMRGYSIDSSSASIEELAKSLSNAIAQASQEYENYPLDRDPETLIHKLYAQSVKVVLEKHPEIFSKALTQELNQSVPASRPRHPA